MAPAVDRTAFTDPRSKSCLPIQSNGGLLLPAPEEITNVFSEMPSVNIAEVFEAE
jgi:hypothetical protein